MKIEIVGLKKRMQKLGEKINKLYKEIDNLREICPHNDVTKKACASTGNYDPTADRYWYECWCNDCGKVWVEDQ